MFIVGDLFAYQDEYTSRRSLAQLGIVINVMGKIHHDIDDVCLTVMIGGKVTEEWASFLVKLQQI